MIKKLSIMVIAGLITAIISFGGRVAQAQAPGASDFCFFSSDVEDFMTVCSNGVAEVHILATSTGAENGTIRLITLDTDFVRLEVPLNGSISTS